MYQYWPNIFPRGLTVCNLPCNWWEERGNMEILSILFPRIFLFYSLMESTKSRLWQGNVNYRSVFQFYASMWTGSNGFLMDSKMEELEKSLLELNTKYRILYSNDLPMWLQIITRLKQNKYLF